MPNRMNRAFYAAEKRITNWSCKLTKNEETGLPEQSNKFSKLSDQTAKNEKQPNTEDAHKQQSTLQLIKSLTCQQTFKKKQEEF